MHNAMVKELEGKNIFRILFESAGEGLVLVDKTGTILLVNPRLLEMFGYLEDELIGSEIEKTHTATLPPAAPRAQAGICGIAQKKVYGPRHEPLGSQKTRPGVSG